MPVVDIAQPERSILFGSTPHAVLTRYPEIVGPVTEHEHREGLNPVACLILKVMLEDVPRHGPELVDDLRRAGAEIKEAAKKDLADLSPGWGYTNRLSLGPHGALRSARLRRGDSSHAVDVALLSRCSASTCSATGCGTCSIRNRTSESCRYGSKPRRPVRGRDQLPDEAGPAMFGAAGGAPACRWQDTQ